MNNTYFLDLKGIIDKLARDQELMLEERLILLRLVEGYVAKVTKELEEELAEGEGSQDG